MKFWYNITLKRVRKEVNKISYFKELIKRLFVHKYIFLLIILNTVISNVCALYLPGLMADIVDIGIKQQGCKDVSMLAKFASQADILQNQVDSSECKVLLTLS